MPLSPQARRIEWPTLWLWMLPAVLAGAQPLPESGPGSDSGQASQQVQVEVLAFAFRAAESTPAPPRAEIPARRALPDDYAARSVPPPAAAVGQKLGTAWQRLHEDPATRPLAHLRWRQGLYDQLWVRLEGAEAFDGRLLLTPGKPLKVSIEATLTPAGGGAPVRLELSRSTRFGEHLYFDHRALGVIVRIDPVLEPAPARAP